MKKLLTILIGICLLAAAVSACAEGAVPEEMSLELGGSSVSYPRISGMEDAELEALINGQIVEDLHVNEYLAQMNALISDEQRGITVTWSGKITGDVFSVVTEAQGAVKPRVTHAWTAANIDLRDGHEITLDELFTDEEAAREAIETVLTEKVAEEMADISYHLTHFELTPVPKTFLLESTGITLLYDVNQLSTLKDRAGAVKIGWNEIRDVADWSEDGILQRIGAADMVALTEDSAEKIRAMTESGQLPDIPVKIGDSVKEWTDRTGLLNDPEEYAGGRMFAPEGAAFRCVYLLSDAVSRGWDESTVQGIRMDRGCVWGLCIGETEASAWHELLGEPDTTAVFDAEDAESWRTVPGRCDYYQYGEYRLQLQYGEDGILVSITLAGV